MSQLKYENVWVKVDESNITSEEVETFTKSDIYYRKQFDIFYITGCLKITTIDFSGDDYDVNISIPELENLNFDDCENTIMITKDDGTEVSRITVQIVVTNQGIKLESLFPFENSTDYSINFQFFIRIKDE